MVASDKPTEDLKFDLLLKEGSELVEWLLPLYKKIAMSLPEEKRNEFFEGVTPLNNRQLSIILSYAALLENMLEGEDGRHQD